MILSDRDIKKAILAGDIGITPFSESNLTPNGYDLTIDEIFIDGEHRKEVVIPPMKWFAISTLEYIKLKKHAAQLWLRSSYARKGVLASFGKVDAGFEGNLTISAFNTHQQLHLKAGETICQIVFEELKSPPLKLYDGKYKGQRGIKLE